MLRHQSTPSDVPTAYDIDCVASSTLPLSSNKLEACEAAETRKVLCGVVGTTRGLRRAAWASRDDDSLD